MTASGWLSLTTELLMLAGILSVLAVVAFSLHPIRWWRYRSIRRERAEQLGVEPMDRARLELAVRLGARR